MIGPRRTVLDKLLVDAAAEAGVEVEEGFTVSAVTSSGGRVTGIRGPRPNGTEMEEQARIVVGADGRHSFVAESVQAEQYNVRPVATCCYYSYWRDVPPHPVTIRVRPRRFMVTTATNDGLTIAVLVAPASEFDAMKGDTDRQFMASIDLVPELAECLRSGERAERYYGTGGVENFFRKPYGDGWALTGDAGYNKDQITAQGISDAFRSAEWLADAIHAGFSGERRLEEALEEYQRIRDEHFLPMYEMTYGFAQLGSPPPEIQALQAALQNNQAEIDRFFGTLAGTVPIPEFYAPENLARIMARAAAAS
jgi:flavin-dependent dehydrogenase